MTDDRLVLVVDDDDDVREIIRCVLEGEGYSVETAANGMEALARLGRPPWPRLMLLDLVMPVMDGTEVIAQLRRIPHGADIAVVVLSGNRLTPESRVRRDANACLQKPVELDALLDVARRYAGG